MGLFFLAIITFVLVWKAIDYCTENARQQIENIGAIPEKYDATKVSKVDPV